jgi:hypothetical protein
MTADGLTSIDEGLYEANEQLYPIEGNSTIVIMTDGIDNAGYHSLMLEALKAKEKNTVIYTVGFGNNESDVDPVLSEIASLTRGEYYFAPNSSVLENIFKGIADQITDFAAKGPVLNIHIPRDYRTDHTVAKATYISGSSNNTVGNRSSFVIPKNPKQGNAEPIIINLNDRSVLTWQLPNLSPGEKWGIWYQMIVQGEGYVPLIMPQSNINYMDLNGTNVTVRVPTSAGGSITGHSGGIKSSPISVSLIADKSMLLINEPDELELWIKDVQTGDPAVATVILYTNLGFFENYENPIVMYDVSGGDKLNFSSATAGNAYVTAHLWNNQSISDDALVVVRPKGMIRIK